MAEDTPKDPAIEPHEYLYGVKVVDIGDLRVARGMSRRPATSCKHRNMRYDSSERRIWCPDCEQNVDAFDAFTQLVEMFSRAKEAHDRREQHLKEAETFQIRSLAAKEIDKAWRSKNSVPACPHCRQGLFPEDFKDGIKCSLGRDYAEARRLATRGDE